MRQRQNLLRLVALAGPTVATFVLAALSGKSSAHPGEVSVAGSPVKGPAVQKLTEVPTGSHSVSTETGAAQSSFAIEVPPGRNGMAPTLALTYSSQTPLRGGIAAGWVLAIPTIEVDTSAGWLAQRHYKSSLSGGQRLVRVGEPAQPGAETYRAENDAEFIRYERYQGVSGMQWRALHPNGLTYLFGETSASKEVQQHSASVIAEGRWMLTRVTDPFGNEIVYEYERVNGTFAGSVVPVDIALVAIRYGRNSPAGLLDHAQVRFDYGNNLFCPDSNIPIGAQFTYRNGVRTYKGYRKLQNILVESRPSPTAAFTVRRKIALGYDPAAWSCNKARAPLRILTSITETVTDAAGTTTVRPAMTFEYGSADRSLEPTGQQPPSDPNAPGKQLGWGSRQPGLNPAIFPAHAGGLPTTRGMLVDVNGDGYVDALKADADIDPDPANETCTVGLSLNTGGTFGTSLIRAWPQRPWENGDPLPNPAGAGREGCSLSHQVDRRKTPPEDDLPVCPSRAANYNTFRLIDLDGDAKPELVTALDYKPGKYDPVADGYTPTLPCPTTTPPCLRGETSHACVPWYELPPDEWPFADNEPPPGSPGTCGCSSGCPVGPTCLTGEGQCATSNCQNCLLEGQLDCHLFREVDLASEVYQRLEESEDGLRKWLGPHYHPGSVGREWSGGQLAANSPSCRYRGEGACGGRRIWRVRVFDEVQNSWVVPSGGTGSLPATMLSPIPLEGPRPTGRFGAMADTSATYAIVDLDGDDCVDAAFSPSPDFDPGWTKGLQVFRGDCQGHFTNTSMTDGAGPPYLWAMPAGADSISTSLSQKVPGPPSTDDFPEGESRWTTENEGLADINGDGLPDWVRKIDNDPGPDVDNVLGVHFNTGRGFEPNGVALTEEPGVVALSREQTVVFERGNDTGHVEHGWSMALLRQHDFDHDGLADLAELVAPTFDHVNPWDHPTRDFSLHINVGDRLIRIPDGNNYQGPWWAGLARITTYNGNKWAVRTDVRDFNGDGLSDMFGLSGSINCRPPSWNDCSATDSIWRDPNDVTGQGLRHLRAINNGRGARIEFEYASSANAAVVDNNGSRLPTPMWVVKRVTVKPGKTAIGTDAEPSITNYTYIQPEYRRDEHYNAEFRGFHIVRVTGPANATGKFARTEYRYQYNLDYSGRLTDTLVSDELNKLQSIESSTWQRASLFNDTVRSYHVVSSSEWVCDAQSQNAPSPESDCRTRGALERRTRRIETVYNTALTYSGIAAGDLPQQGAIVVESPPSGAFPILYVVRGERITHVTGNVVANDRGVVHGEQVLYLPGRYQILPTDARKVVATQASWSGHTVVARSQTQYDSFSFGFPVTSRVWFGPAELQRSETWRGFEESTGNVTSTTDPAGLVTILTYDTFKLYPAQTKPTMPGDPIDRTVKTTRDVHTGLPTKVEGPQQPGKTSWPTVETTYDGEGRPIAVRRSFDSGSNYALFTVALVFYRDADVAPFVESVEVREVIDHLSGAQRIRETTYDGLGRPLKETVQAPPLGAAVSFYAYDPAGNVIAHYVPNPTGGTGTVMYAFEHDALGRVTRSIQPAGAGEWNFIYDGVRTTRRQVVADSSIALQSVLDSDSFGRLVRVAERRPGQADAVWTYAYDPNDNMRSILDADGVTTSMVHDMASRRTQVARAGKTWTYGYDAAGRLESEATPPPTPETAAAYISTWAYDALGRVKSHVTAKRNLTDPQLAKYFPASPTARMTVYGYDGANRGSGVGRLTDVDLTFGTVDYHYTVEGRVSREDRAFSIAPAGITLADGQNASRRYNYAYNALGAPTRIDHADHTTPSSRTATQATYDSRGLPLAVSRVSPAALLAQVDRNPAGLPTVRYSGFGQGQNWTYDPVGRVWDHTIRSCALGATTPAQSKTCAQTGTIRGGESIGYYDSGNVETIQDRLQGTQFVYTFDGQHQLENASTVNAPAGSITYESDFTYSPGGRILTARVDSSGTGPDVMERDVVYEYTGTAPQADPAAVRRLAPQPGGGSAATFDYDERGNLTRKIYGTDQRDFIYDGDDLVREVTNGTNREIYYYDHNGQRMLAWSSAWNGQSAKLRFWFGDTEIEYSPTASSPPVNQTLVFARLGAVPVARIRRSGSNNVVAVLYSGVLNHLLTVLNTTNSSPVAQFGYGPFGEQLYSLGSSAADYHRLYNGEEHDEFTSLSYYGARYYDRLTLTWTQFDPLYRFVPDLAWDSPRRSSLYSFTLNNPLRYIDPDGKDPWERQNRGVNPRAPAAVQGMQRTLRDIGPIAVKTAGVYLDATVQTAKLVGTAAYELSPASDAVGLAEAVWERDLKGIAVNGALVILGVATGGSGKAAAKGVAKGLEVAIDAARLADRGREVGIVAKGCFVAGTLIAAAHGLVPIDELHVGDVVISREEHTGIDGVNAVTAVFVRENAEVIEIVVTDGHEYETLETTAEHPFWVDGRGWAEVGALEPGNRFVAQDGRMLELSAVQTTSRRATVYNIEVRGAHTYFVGSLGTWVHNKAMGAKLSGKERRARDQARTAAEKAQGRHLGNMDEAHRAQKAGDVEDLIDKEQGIKQSYPDQPARRTEQRIREKMREEADHVEAE